MQRWMDEVDGYLAELLRLEGRCNFTTEMCPGCQAPTGAAYRCNDCHGGELYCAPCIVKDHFKHPLHRIHVSSCSCTMLSPLILVAGMEGWFLSLCFSEVVRTASSTGPSPGRDMPKRQVCLCRRLRSPRPFWCS